MLVLTFECAFSALVSALCVCPSASGAAAARVLTAQLSHWRFSQLWPHWLAAGSTSTVQQQLQQLHTLCEATQSLSSNAASKAADGCVSMLMLLAKLMLLSEAQMLQQLAPDSQTASRWVCGVLAIRRVCHSPEPCVPLYMLSSCESACHTRNNALCCPSPILSLRTNHMQTPGGCSCWCRSAGSTPCWLVPPPCSFRTLAVRCWRG